MKKFTCKVCTLGVTITGQQTVAAWARQLSIDPKSVVRHIAHGDRSGATSSAPDTGTEESSDGSKSITKRLNRAVTLQDARDWVASSGDNPDDYKLRVYSTAYGVDMWSNHMSATPDPRRRGTIQIDLPALYAEVAKTKRAPEPVGTRERTVVICWADIQTGKVDRLGDTKALLIRLDQKRVALEKYLRDADATHHVIADVGDIVEGFDNVASQVTTNDLSLMDQVDVAATEFWKTIRLSAKYAPTDVLSIPSNHAQWRRGKGLAGKPGDDWGLHISKRLEALNEEARLPLTFHRPGEWDETLTLDIRGTILGLAHGHQAGSPDRVTAWWTKMTHAGVMDCDILLQGHFHHLRIEPSGKSPRTHRSRWRIQAPTLDNGSAWVNNLMGEDGEPGLLVFQIGDDGFDLSSLAIL